MGAVALRFEVYRHGGEFWFRLVGGDGELLLFSGPQTCLDACLEVVAELKAIVLARRARVDRLGEAKARLIGDLLGKG